MKLQDVKAFLRKQQRKKGKNILLYAQYEAVLQDLISDTDSCTGELYL